jgi:hypothetical protein
LGANGTFTAEANAVVKGDLQVLGASSVTGACSIGGTLAVTSSCAVTGNLTVKDKFFVQASSGDTIILGTCAVTNSFAVGDSFGVSSATGDCSATSFISTSDGTLKQDIVSIPTDDALRVVMGMRAVKYAFIDKPDDPRAGVIAQEMREVAPELVKTITPADSTGRDAHLAVNYGDMTAYLIGALQDLQTTLICHTSTIAALKLELDILKGQPAL